MGSLSNLYVSQSYQSLLHLSTDTAINNFANPPGYNSVEDGLGNALGFAISSSGDVLFSQSVQINDNLSVDGNFDVDGNIIISGTFDIEGKVTVNDNVRINGNLEVSGSTKLTGSLAISDAISASNMLITNDLNVGGTLFASKVVTLIESSSIIYSSGSNILGDETSDTQTLIGLVRVSGSSQLTGSMGITGNLNVLGNISSSTISGIGNVTSYSQSVDARLDIVEATASLYVPFSQSVDSRLDAEELSSSVLNTSASLALVTASFDLGTRNLTLNKGNNDTFSLFIPGTLIPSGTVSSSAQINIYDTTNFATFNDAIQFDIGQKLFTSSFNAYTQSYSASVATTTTGLNDRINTLSSFTGSYATTGSNTFIGNQVISGSVNVSGSTTFLGNQTITGSLTLSSSAAIELTVIGNSVFSGSVRGRVVQLGIVAQTASMDLSLANFFTITLNTSQSCRIEPTNIQPGETVTLRVTQASGGGGTVQFPANVDYPTGFQYNATPTGSAVDILTFLSFDTASLYYSRANQFI